MSDVTKVLNLITEKYEKLCQHNCQQYSFH